MIDKIGKYKAVIILFAAGFLLIVLGWVWAYFSFRGINQPIIIHFDSHNGITKIGGVNDISAVSISAIIISFINFLIAIELEKRDRFWGKLISASNLFLCVLIFIMISVIIHIN